MVSKLIGMAHAIKDTHGLKETIRLNTLNEDTPQSDDLLKQYIIDSLAWLDSFDD